MVEVIVNVLRGVPPELATLVLSMIPIGELRGALPTALFVYDMPLWKAFALSVIGNMIPVYFLLVALKSVSEWLRSHSAFMDRLLTKLYERTRHKLEGKVNKHGAWALALFVAVPLPVTGAWTGALAAFVFGLSRKKSFVAIFIGLLMSATIVSFLALGASVTFKALLG